ncbi:NAD(P)H-dependent oxidoreductase [Thalassotalea ponticola]|uniref:FMN-dependent NADH-azoreductase n=1 Tax=Thalassotalea ponticola TaxID=1523392 RepID=UPI0025B56406|nr:NAD(P)H-dependent oxidoreductase [Thalassotalea ponticola]MDN3652343.1 NAD(P)H-dependent oxidoreductase [Thalassotalea ponticola]
MNQILFIKTSLSDEQSNSNKLASELIAKFKQQTNASVVTRDVAKHPLPHLTQQEMAAWMTPQDERNAQQQDLANISDTLVQELKDSDTIVVAIPMYNFGVPSTFKAWVDRIARAGVTFSYTENGPVGLLTNKKVIIVAARGGMYKGTEKDSQTQFLKDFFSFIGLTDVRFIYAEGLNMPGADLSLAAAQSEIESFAV